MFTNIFVIHLEHETDKRTRLEEQLRREHLQYEFVPGVDGQNDDLSQYHFSVLPSWSEPFTRKTMTRGEVGCALSHYQLWKRIVDEHLPYTLILEDDTVLCPDLMSKLTMLNDVPYELMYLGRRPLHESTELQVNESIVRAKYSYGTHAYILSYAGAQKLIGNYLENLIPVDEYISLMYDFEYPHKEYTPYFKREMVEAYSVTPLLIHIMEGDLYKSTTYHTDPYTSPSSDSYMVLSVGTSPNDALARFERSCHMYGHPYTILGRNTEWGGGCMAKGPGGGQKINLLRQELLTWSEKELERVVLFTDSYDVIFVTHPKEILEKYQRYSDKILFSSEPSCWPDSSLASAYPSPHYLNSGGFIGKGKHILSLLEDVPPESDDQLYYTLQFLQGKNILLDITSTIFQTLNQTTVRLLGNGRVQHNQSYPCLLHGNGPPSVKRYLNSIDNHLSGWSSTYKFCITQRPSTPLVYVCAEYTPELTYPKDRLLQRFFPLNKVVEDFLSTDAEYLLVIEPTYYLTHPNTLNELLSMNKTIVGPMLKRNASWTNFWGDISDIGYYQRSWDYFDIVNYKKKAVWNVPYLTGVYLIRRSFLELYPHVYTYESMDTDMAFARNVRESNYFMYVSNLTEYGYIETDPFTNLQNPSWEERYIHPEYLAHRTQVESICEEKCTDVFYFPLFTKAFCDELIQQCEASNAWSDGRSDVIDSRIRNYENVPTRDIHMHQLKLDDLWKQIVFKYIAPVATKMYQSYVTKDINIAFVVKYSMDGQRDLKPHHDSSTYTVNICLNDEFEGGGCHFIRQKTLLEHRQVGYASMHPGKLTHYHEGLPITAGKRYILVSFIH